MPETAMNDYANHDVKIKNINKYKEKMSKFFKANIIEPTRDPRG